MKNSLVEDLKRELETNRLYGLALDIDDTLAKGVEYSLERIHADLNIPTNMSIQEMCKKYGKYEGSFWRQPKVLEWFDNDKNDVTENYPLIDNVEEYVNKINDIIPIRAYITARKERHSKGTQVWLNKFNFPKATLICQPESATFDSASAWKAKVLEFLSPNIAGIVDDNKYLTAELSNDYPGTHYLYGFERTSFNHIDVVACPDWECVYEEIKRRYSN